MNIENQTRLLRELEFRINQARQPEFFIIRDTLLSELRGFISAVARMPVSAELYSDMFDQYNDLVSYLKSRENEQS